jgi:molybdopterin converting factor small subunit
VKQLVEAWQQELGDRIEKQALQYQWAHATTQVSVIINDEMIPQSSALETTLKEGDVVTLLPIVTGG